MQARAPVHVANIQVGLSHRQLPSELDFTDLMHTLRAKAGTRGTL